MKAVEGETWGCHRKFTCQTTSYASPRLALKCSVQGMLSKMVMPLQLEGLSSLLSHYTISTASSFIWRTLAIQSRLSTAGSGTEKLPRHTFRGKHIAVYKLPGLQDHRPTRSFSVDPQTVPQTLKPGGRQAKDQRRPQLYHMDATNPTRKLPPPTPQK